MAQREQPSPSKIVEHVSSTSESRPATKSDVLRQASVMGNSQRLLPSGDEAGTAPEDRSFRPDIQGLRAVAVMLVVFAHVGIPRMGNGVIGVDVFFVISGFVITGVLLRERAATGHTGIVNFYGRRAETNYSHGNTCNRRRSRRRPNC